MSKKRLRIVELQLHEDLFSVGNEFLGRQFCHIIENTVSQGFTGSLSEIPAQLVKD